MPHGRQLKWIGSVICAVALVLALIPTALAADPSPAASSNINKEDYSTWSKPITSYLYANEAGGLTRVEYINGQVVVEDYSANFSLLNSQTIQPELPIWGGFFAGEDFHFLIFGQKNPSESDSTEVIRVVKYDKSWNRLGAASLNGANTTIPFDAGSLRCDEYNGYLYLRTCHEMYASLDGIHHQANLTMAIQQSDMSITDSFSRVMNISYGYVSHSFNQFILADQAGNLVALDHGDAYPRSFVLVGYSSNASTGKFSDRSCWNKNLQTFAGAIGANTTGASVGGFAETESGYVAAYNYDGIGGNGPRSVYLHFIDSSTHADQQRLLPNSSGSATPVLAPTGLSGGYLMWNGKSGYSPDDTLYYVTYDAQGVPTAVQTAQAPLSDCQPIPYGDGVVWYVTQNSAPTFYTLGPSGLNAYALEQEPEPTPTPTPTPALTPTPTPTPTLTPTPTPTPTPTLTPTPTPTPTPVPSGNPVSFTDVPASIWYREYVYTAAQAGLMKGTGSSCFSPDTIFTVAEVVTLTARLHAEQSDATVPQDGALWYLGAYDYCLDHGLFTASEVPFSTLEQKATRFQMVELMDRAVPAEEKQAILTVADGDIPDLREREPYGDVVYSWYRAGITQGDQAGRFNGSAQISRAEVATILCRLAGLTPRTGADADQPSPAPSPVVPSDSSESYSAPELAFSLPVSALSENSSMRITLLDSRRHELSDDSGVTWVNETPEILRFQESQHVVYPLQTGVGRLSASWNGSTASMTIHVYPSEDTLSLSVLATLLSPGVRSSTQLYVFDYTRYYGQNYTVQWSVDRPDLLTLEETTIDGNAAVRFTALQCGDAVITCQVTLPDGSSTCCYCCVSIRPE